MLRLRTAQGRRLAFWCVIGLSASGACASDELAPAGGRDGVVTGQAVVQQTQGGATLLCFGPMLGTEEQFAATGCIDGLEVGGFVWDPTTEWQGQVRMEQTTLTGVLSADHHRFDVTTKSPFGDDWLPATEVAVPNSYNCTAASSIDPSDQDAIIGVLFDNRSLTAAPVGAGLRIGVPMGAIGALRVDDPWFGQACSAGLNVGGLRVYEYFSPDD